MYTGISKPTIGTYKRNNAKEKDMFEGKVFKVSIVFKMKLSDVKICIYFNIISVIYP